MHTGVALIWLDKGVFLAGGEVSHCRTRKLSDAELKDLSAKHHDKAGAYAVQDADDEFVEKIEGRFDTVVGLPMNLVRKFLKKANYSGLVAASFRLRSPGTQAKACGYQSRCCRGT